MDEDHSKNVGMIKMDVKCMGHGFHAITSSADPYCIRPRMPLDGQGSITKG